MQSHCRSHHVASVIGAASGIGDGGELRRILVHAADARMPAGMARHVWGSPARSV